MNQSILDVCQKALFQLRQDVTVPSLADAETCTDLEWVKCRHAFDTARTEILNCHDWRFAEDVVPAGDAEETSGPDEVYGERRYALPEATASGVRVLRVIGAFDHAERIGFHVRGGNVFTSQPATAFMVVYDNDDVSTWDSQVANALVYLTARECAVPIAGRVEDLKNMDALYKDKIGNAIVEDLNDSIDTVSDADIQYVINQIVPIYTAGQPMLPKSIESVANMIASQKDAARREVICSHDWNFSTQTERREDGDIHLLERGDGFWLYEADAPANMLKLVSVRDVCGKTCEWTIHDGVIKSDRQVSSIRYSVDVPVSRFSPHARAAYLERLCALCAKKVSGNDQVQLKHEQLYRDALKEAMLRDVEQSRAPSDAWGDNFYVRKMRGDGDVRRDPFRRP